MIDLATTGAPVGIVRARGYDCNSDVNVAGPAAAPPPLLGIVARATVSLLDHRADRARNIAADISRFFSFPCFPGRRSEQLVEASRARARDTRGRPRNAGDRARRAAIMTTTTTTARFCRTSDVI